MPEVRPIDREKLLADIENEIEFFSSSPGNHSYFDYNKKNGLIIARHIIERQPTIEAEPVRKPEMSEADRKKCEELCKDCEHTEMCAWYPFSGCDFRLLQKPEQPTIEPEVRHGRWIPLEGWFNKNIAKCSVCGNTLNMDGVNAGRGDANFCPNCGARMDATDTNVGGKGGTDNA